MIRDASEPVHAFGRVGDDPAFKQYVGSFFYRKWRGHAGTLTGVIRKCRWAGLFVATKVAPAGDSLFGLVFYAVVGATLVATDIILLCCRLVLPQQLSWRPSS
jgi:hypothetical protein